jgi:hypothetical protein
MDNLAVIVVYAEDINSFAKLLALQNRVLYNLTSVNNDFMAV